MLRELENRELGVQGIQSEGNEGSMELGGARNGEQKPGGAGNGAAGSGVQPGSG